jgi:hypothetical protein
LIDVLDGGADAASREHAQSCGRCRQRLLAVRAGLTLAREAEVPEPSPLYWETFRSQVELRIGRGEQVPRWGLRPAFAMAAALAALLAVLPGSPPEREPLGPPTLPAWSALPPVAEDVNLVLLQGLLAPEEDLVVAAGRQGIPWIVAELSDAERQELARALQSELKGGKS